MKEQFWESFDRKDKTLFTFTRAEFLEHFSVEENDDVLYTGATVVMVPLPDFSMPFNVLTLTSSIIAFYFGHTFNLFTRKREIFPEKKKKKKCTWLTKLFRKE